MYFRCTEKECGSFIEDDQMPEGCPQCAGSMAQVEEHELSGDDWSALGVFWAGQRGGDGKALNCFRKSASMGSSWGVCNLGLCMEQGTGIEADPRQAFWLYQQAVEMGSVSALCNLGVC